MLWSKAASMPDPSMHAQLEAQVPPRLLFIKRLDGVVLFFAFHIHFESKDPF